MSADEDELDFAAIGWPGFVDILSSVIMMFVFFVMITASALYFHIIIFKAKIVAQSQDVIEHEVRQRVEQERMESLQKENVELKEQIEEVKEQKQEIEEKIQYAQEMAEFADSKDQRIIEDEEERSVVVFFGTDSISLTEDSQAQITEIIEKYLQKGSSNVRVSIVAGRDQDSQVHKISRKLALARMLNVRNVFLDTEVKQANVSGSISGNYKIEKSYHWVKIVFEYE